MIDSIKLHNLVTNTQLIIDNTSSEFILEEVRWGPVEGSHNSYSYVGQTGESIEDTILGTRDLRIVGWVTGSSLLEIKNKKRTLNVFVNPQHDIILSTDKYEIQFRPDTSIKYGEKDSENNEVMCKFTIVGFCANPLFSLSNEIKVSAASMLPKFHFPFAMTKTKGIIFGLRQPSLITNAINKGDVPASVRIEFYAKGTVKNPMLVHIGKQKYIKINKTMLAGEKIVIVTERGSKKVTGFVEGSEFNYYQFRDYNSSWLELELGDNLLRYDAEENIEALEVFIYFNPKYLEVE